MEPAASACPSVLCMQCQTSSALRTDSAPRCSIFKLGSAPAGSCMTAWGLRLCIRGQHALLGRKARFACLHLNISSQDALLLGQVSGTIPAVGSGLRGSEGPPLESQLQRELRLDPPAGPQSLLNSLPSASMPPEQQMPCLAGAQLPTLCI